MVQGSSREVPEPHAGPGEVRVRVTAAGLNPMDWYIAARPKAAARFGITVPSGSGSGLAGAAGSVGDRVYGAALGRAVAGFVVVRPPADSLRPMPDGISDEVAGTIGVAAATAAAALAAIGLRSGDTVLIGGAAGGVGVLATRLAVLAGDRDRHRLAEHLRVPAAARRRAGGLRKRR